MRKWVNGGRLFFVRVADFSTPLRSARNDKRGGCHCFGRNDNEMDSCSPNQVWAYYNHYAIESAFKKAMNLDTMAVVHFAISLQIEKGRIFGRDEC